MRAESTSPVLQSALGIRARAGCDVRGYRAASGCVNEHRPANCLAALDFGRSAEGLQRLLQLHTRPGTSPVQDATDRVFYPVGEGPVPGFGAPRPVQGRLGPPGRANLGDQSRRATTT